ALSAGDIITTTTTLYVFSPGSGSCPDAQNPFTVTVTDQPDAGSDAPIAICAGNGASTDLFAALGGADNGGTWNDDDASGADLTDPADVDLSALPAGSYAFTYTIPASGGCLQDQATITVTVTPAPVVDAGSDQEVCQGAVHDMASSSTLPSASGTGALLWQTAGDGSFSDTSVLLPVYTPGINDIANGSVVLTLRGAGNGPCGPVNDSMTLTITPAPLADAPADVTACDSYILPALANGNYFDAPNGGGNALSAGDIITTTTTLYVFSPGSGSCPDAQNPFTVTVTDQPDAGTDGALTICEGTIVTEAQLFAQLGGTPDAGGSWSPAPAGAGV
ncbi:MAG: hypothetical protein ABGX00_13195, partial [Allomuricauda sp.]